MKNRWYVAAGVVDDEGTTVEHEPVDPLIVELVHAFPHRVEAWAPDDRLVGSGALDDDGRSFFALELGPGHRRPVAISVDVLGVEADALA